MKHSPKKTRCPRCDSPSPELHPAMQCEGEVQPCPHEWHKPTKMPKAPEKGGTR